MFSEHLACSVLILAAVWYVNILEHRVMLSLVISTHKIKQHRPTCYKLITLRLLLALATKQFVIGAMPYHSNYSS